METKRPYSWTGDPKIDYRINTARPVPARTQPLPPDLMREGLRIADARTRSRNRRHRVRVVAPRARRQARDIQIEYLYVLRLFAILWSTVGIYSLYATLVTANVVAYASMLSSVLVVAVTLVRHKSIRKMMEKEESS